MLNTVTTRAWACDSESLSAPHLVSSGVYLAYRLGERPIGGSLDLDNVPEPGYSWPIGAVRAGTEREMSRFNVRGAAMAKRVPASKQAA